VAECDGNLPNSVEILQTFPGIGKATAGALAAFAFHQPVVFIETNIRRVFLHFFFPEREGVNDREILPLVEQTLDRDQVRQWYYALMDYGAMLGRGTQNANRRSAHHSRQSSFQGSDRQIRGLILKVLVEHPALSAKDLTMLVDKDPERTARIAEGLVREGFVEVRSGLFSISTGNKDAH
jgi:A/G-specific adenine glycosylase